MLTPRGGASIRMRSSSLPTSGLSFSSVFHQPFFFPFAFRGIDDFAVIAVAIVDTIHRGDILEFGLALWLPIATRAARSP